jgi:hypothetical protein
MITNFRSENLHIPVWKGQVVSKIMAIPEHATSQ